MLTDVSRLAAFGPRRLGQRASIDLGQARVPTDAPVPGDRADERRVPRLRQGSHRAARLWWPPRGFKDALADNPGREGER